MVDMPAINEAVKELLPWAVLYHPYDRREPFVLNDWTPVLPWTTVALYLVMVFATPPLLKALKVKPMGLRGVAAIWNLFLSVISLVMLLGVGIPFFADIQERGLSASMCDANKSAYDVGPQAVLFWAYVFALSKYAELFDTVLLLLKQKPVNFLHWWHHTTVLLFTWYAEYYRMTAGFVFIVVNAFVHTIMYFYYFLSETGRRPGNSVAMMITVIQILQMFIGIATVVYNWYMTTILGIDCACNEKGIIYISCAIMYGSYLFLFMKFFLNRYVFSKGPTRPNTSRPAPAGGKKPTKAE